MSLRKKLEIIEKKFSDTYEVLKVAVPNLVNDPEHASEEDIDHYNFWIDGILDEDAAQELYELSA